MSLIRCVKAVLVGLAVVPAFNLMAQDLAFPGYSGFLNVPSASVLGHGQAEIGYSDQGFVGGEYGHYHNFHAAVGVFPNLEIGGRVIWNDTQANLFTDCCGPRDLSANVKLQIPFIPEHWFSLAAGAQDLGRWSWRWAMVARMMCRAIWMAVLPRCLTGQPSGLT